MTIEFLYYVVAKLAVVESCESYAFRVSVSLSHDSGRVDFGAESAVQELGQHLLIHVGGQVGEVKISGVLLTLLG